VNTGDLEQIYGKKLNDLYDAEKQIIAALPKMSKAASSSDLKEAFEKHLEQTKGHVMRLDEIFERGAEREQDKTCKGMEGLLKEGEELLNEEEQGPALDVALIAAAQSVEHYEMAGYGSAQTWARQLGHKEAANLLEETLEEEKETDAELTEIAEALVNPEAGGTAEEDLEDDEELEDEESLEEIDEEGEDLEDVDEEEENDIEEEERSTPKAFNSPDGEGGSTGKRKTEQHGQANRKSGSSSSRKPKR
jgi:ferritin-like metal-binding protein YciE